MATNRCVLLKLTIATAKHFTTEAGKLKYGAMYFQQSCTGAIEQKLYEITPETDITEFKKLFDAGQIYMIDNENPIASTFNCIDWDLINQQLDFELERLNEIINK